VNLQFAKSKRCCNFAYAINFLVNIIRGTNAFLSALYARCNQSGKSNRRGRSTSRNKRKRFINSAVRSRDFDNKKSLLWLREEGENMEAAFESFIPTPPSKPFFPREAFSHRNILPFPRLISTSCKFATFSTLPSCSTKKILPVTLVPSRLKSSTRLELLITSNKVCRHKITHWPHLSIYNRINCRVLLKYGREITNYTGA
jgi:hypothetical protein